MIRVNEFFLAEPHIAMPHYTLLYIKLLHIKLKVLTEKFAGPVK